MTYFEDRLAGYDRIHRDPLNRALHAVGIPTIQFGVLGLFGLVKGPLPFLTGATLLIAIGFVVMARYSLRAAIAQTLLALFIAYVAAAVAEGRSALGSAGIFLSAFVIGWIIQFVGHAFERQPPEFVRSPLNLLLGPLFVLNEVFRVLPDSVRGEQR
jgi:uncharacterized membrane protein YGL010W